MKSSDAISSILKLLENGKETWLNELARKAGVPLGSIRYLIFGQTKLGKFYGGYLKDEVLVKTEGRNAIVRLRYPKRGKIE